MTRIHEQMYLEFNQQNTIKNNYQRQSKLNQKQSTTTINQL